MDEICQVYLHDFRVNSGVLLHTFVCYASKCWQLVWKVGNLFQVFFDYIMIGKGP